MRCFCPLAQAPISFTRTAPSIQTKISSERIMVTCSKNVHQNSSSPEQQHPKTPNLRSVSGTCFHQTGRRCYCDITGNIRIPKKMKCQKLTTHEKLLPSHFPGTNDGFPSTRWSTFMHAPKKHATWNRFRRNFSRHYWQDICL